MAARKAALLREQGWLGPEHAVAAVDILAEDGERSLAALFAGLDRERPLVVITEGLVNYFQRPVIEAFWSRLATELKRFPQGTYLTDLYPDLREHPRYRPDPLGSGDHRAADAGSYPLHYRNAAEIEAAFARCGFASSLVLDPQREGAAPGLAAGTPAEPGAGDRKPHGIAPFRRPPLAARRRGGRPVRRWPPDRSAGR
ncbi:putative O-methyltransferase [Pseudomonas aeruginosa]|nr:putative O-methyltransferase [Pseudomonas aeruginosa]